MRELNVKFHLLPDSRYKAYLIHIYVNSDSPAKCFYSPTQFGIQRTVHKIALIDLYRY